MQNHIVSDCPPCLLGEVHFFHHSKGALPAEGHLAGDSGCQACLSGVPHETHDKKAFNTEEAFGGHRKKTEKQP